MKTNIVPFRFPYPIRLTFGLLALACIAGAVVCMFRHHGGVLAVPALLLAAFAFVKLANSQ